MLPVSDTTLCCGHSIGGSCSIAAFSVRPVPIAITMRLARAQPPLDLGRGRLGDADRGRGRFGIARHDLDEVEREARLQPRREVQAIGDRMVDADLDQSFRHRQRHQALRRLARHAELGRDLVLRIAGDIVEPAGARRVVEPVAARLLARSHVSVHSASPPPRHR